MCSATSSCPRQSRTSPTTTAHGNGFSSSIKNAASRTSVANTQNRAETHPSDGDPAFYQTITHKKNLHPLHTSSSSSSSTMAKKTYDLLFKLLLIGDSGVGKTCILFRFSDDAFSTTFISTIGIDFKIKTVELRGKKIKLQIWDTAGQERFHTITTSYYRGAMGIMLVYDITNEKTFENIVNWLRNIDEHANENVEKMILGNKSDMEDRREVSTERGEAIAREHGIRFMETSAKANINIDRAFRELAEAILDKTQGKEPHEQPDRVQVDRRFERATNRCC